MSGPIRTHESLQVSAPMWPRRRWLAAALLAPVLGGVVLAVTRPAQDTAGPAWWVLLALVVLAGAGTLASYVPASGVRPDVGCTPCAAVSALTVVAAVMLLRDAGPDLTAVALAAAVSIFGLGQRLSQPRACVSPGGREG
jgi:peptidoglycan/LPS O-acetylase OafA/YrhL